MKKFKNLHFLDPLFSFSISPALSKVTYFRYFSILGFFLLLFYFNYEVRAFFLFFFYSVEQQKLEGFILVYVFLVLSLLMFLVLVGSILIEFCVGNRLFLWFDKKCVENKFLLSLVGVVFCLLLFVSALVELRAFHILLLMLFLWSVLLSGKSLPDIFWGWGVALIHPKGLIFFFAVLQFNFMTFLFFDTFCTFVTLGYPLAYFAVLPVETWVKMSAPWGKGKFDGIFWMKPVDFDLVNAECTKQLAQKLVNLYAKEFEKPLKSSKAAFTKNLEIVYKDPLDKQFPTIFKNLGLEKKTLFKAYVDDPLKAQEAIKKIYPKLLFQCTPKEQEIFYNNPLEVCLAIEMVEDTNNMFSLAIRKECLRGLLAEASQGFPDRLADGLLGKDAGSQALKALSTKPKYLGTNPLATFLLGDKNHIVQSQNPVATFVNDFSAARLVSGVNELATAVNFGENQGGVVEIGRSFLGDVSVKTAHTSAVLSVKENGEGRLAESLEQVDKALKKSNLKVLHAEESHEKDVREYYVVTAGKGFTNEELMAQGKQIKMLQKHFNKEWKQRFDAKNLGKK